MATKHAVARGEVGSDSYHCRHQASEGREGHDTERSLFIACNEFEDGFGLPRLANAKDAATLFDLLPDFVPMSGQVSAVPKVTGQGCQLAQHVLLQGVLARGWLDLPATLQPVEDSPAKGGPGCADAPAGEHVGGIVNTEVDTTDADSDGEQDRQAEEIDLEP